MTSVKSADRIMYLVVLLLADSCQTEDCQQFHDSRLTSKLSERHDESLSGGLLSGLRSTDAGRPRRNLGGQGVDRHGHCKQRSISL